MLFGEQLAYESEAMVFLDIWPEREYLSGCPT
jgi:hypothetical protein